MIFFVLVFRNGLATLKFLAAQSQSTPAANLLEADCNNENASSRVGELAKGSDSMLLRRLIDLQNLISLYFVKGLRNSARPADFYLLNRRIVT